MWWKIYFWIFAVLTIVGVFLSLGELNKLTLVDWVGLLLNLILVISTYSFVMNKKLFSKETWGLLFWVNLFFLTINVVYEFLLPENIKSSLTILQSSIEADMGMILFSFLVSIPALYALYKLAYNKAGR